MHFRYALLPFASLVALSLGAQDLAGTAPSNRTALLEEFTAINCGNCPAAHAVASTLQSAYTEDLVIIGVHGGALANPSSGQPDLRTTDGAALWVQEVVTFQPQGIVNRGSLQPAAQWNSSIADVVAQPSPVNVGAMTTFNAATRELQITLELYYTVDPAGGGDRISVVLTQDHIIGYQQDYVNGAHPAYDHRHVLRDHITPLAGLPVLLPEGSSLWQTVMDPYVVPEAWVIEDLSVVVFVGEEGGPVYQIRSLPASGGSTVGMVDDRRYGTGPAFPVPASDVVVVPLTSEVSGVLAVRDATGRVVRRERVSAGAAQLVLSVQDLEAGTYFYGMEGCPARRLVVAR